MRSQGGHAAARQDAGVRILPTHGCRPNQSFVKEDAAKSPCAHCGVRNFTPCAALGDGELHNLGAIMSHRRLAPHQTVFVEGDRAEFAYNILAGGLKLLKSLADGRTQITGVLLPGDFLGIPPGGRYKNSAEALPGTVLCQLPRASLQALFAKYRALETRMQDAVYDDWAVAQEHMLLLGRMSAIERVCTFILGLAQRLERTGGTVELLTIPLHRNEIADYLGLTLETVSRVVSQLRRDGIIRLVRSDQILIDDQWTLEEIANGG